MSNIYESSNLPKSSLGDLRAYPHLFPAVGFTQVDRNGQQAIVAAGTTTLETIQITTGCTGWIRKMALFGQNMAQMFFTLNYGGAPLRDYTRLNTVYGDPATPRDCFIELLPNLPLVLTVTTTVFPVAVRWVMWGWYNFPEEGRRGDD